MTKQDVSAISAPITPLSRNFNHLWGKLHALPDVYFDLANAFGLLDVDWDFGIKRGCRIAKDNQQSITEWVSHDQQHDLTPKLTRNFRPNTNIGAFLHELILSISFNVCCSLICRISTTVKTTIHRTPLNSMSRFAREE